MIKNLKWKYALPVCIFLVFLSLIPQISLQVQRGEQYNGSTALLDVNDETAYCSYLRSLINGSSRKNNPYTAQENLSAESLYSIQFIPSYALAISSRLFGISADTSFILASVFSSFFVGLTVFWLIGLLTEDSLLTLAGSLLVLIFGNLFAGQGALKELLGLGESHVFFPFMRRYIPALVMPFLFLFFGLVWVGLKEIHIKKKIIFCLLSCLTFNVLLYSYFYLWSAILAWIGICSIFYVIFFYKHHSKNNIIFLAATFSICLLSLIPYFRLISQMRNEESVLVLETTRMPILTHPTLLASYVLLIITLILFQRKLLNGNRLRYVFLAGFLCLPFIVFNQQIITGHSLQPFHYSRYVANYSVLLGIVLLIRELIENIPSVQKVRQVILFIIPLICIWGIVEAWFVTSYMQQTNVSVDQAKPVQQYLANISSRKPIREQTTINFDFLQSKVQPTIAPQPVLWAYHLNTFNNISEKEYRDRYYKYIYFMGIKPETVETDLMNCPESLICTQIFNWRFNPTITIKDKSPKSDEIEKVIREYKEFYENFNRAKASKPNLAFAIVRKDTENDFSNLDLWYERSVPQQFGDFILYNLKLK